MPRPVSSTLAALLPNCETLSTVSIDVRDDQTYYFANRRDINIDGQDYLKGLKEIGEITETKGSAVNSVSFKIQNVDQVWGAKVADPARVLDLSTAVIKRFYVDPKNPATWEHKWLFDGAIAVAEVTEDTVNFEVISETGAKGTCVATATLSPRNGWNFPGVPSQYPPGSGINPFPGIGGGQAPGDGSGGCFLAGAPVLTPLGDRPIERVKRGWKVYSFDPEGNIEEDVVDDVHIHWVSKYLEFWLDDGGYLGLTPEQPLWYQTRNFERADSFQMGSSAVGRLIGDEFTWPKLARYNVRKNLKTPVPVYNLTVRKNHTYFVNGVAVHNKIPIEYPY